MKVLKARNDGEDQKPSPEKVMKSCLKLEAKKEASA